jgi:hypothetical protein
MEQWFYQLLGPGVPLILEQWNNGLTNFWGRGTGTMEQWFDQLF